MAAPIAKFRQTFARLQRLNRRAVPGVRWSHPVPKERACDANQSSNSIRTVALVGHGAAGKTTLAESLLAATGTITTGARSKKATRRVISIRWKRGRPFPAKCHCRYAVGGVTLHLIDTPGYPDFAGPAIAAFGWGRYSADRGQRADRNRTLH